MCVMRTAVSTLFTFCPPLPPERNVSTRNSVGGMTISDDISSICAIASTLAKLVCRRLFESNGEMRTSRCTPRSALQKP